jgi:hypothetical protein
MTRMLTLLRLAAEAIIVIVDARDLGARVGQQPGVDVAAHLARHEVRTRVKQICRNAHCRTGTCRRST